MTENGAFSLTLERVGNYEFETRFDLEHLPPILLDEPPPLGSNRGPNASRMLAAPVGNCLSASLLFCLEKSKVSWFRYRPFTRRHGMERRRRLGAGWRRRR